MLRKPFKRLEFKGGRVVRLTDIDVLRRTVLDKCLIVATRKTNPDLMGAYLEPYAQLGMITDEA
jgi:hypothetical protein